MNGLTLNGSTVSGRNGLDFSPNGTGSPDGLTGTVSIANSTITAGGDTDISDTSGTLHLTATGTTFGGTNPGNIALDINADGTTDATVSVTGSTFTNNDGGAFQFATDPASTGTGSVTFSNNTFFNTAPGIPAGGVLITPDGNGTTCAAITGNQGADIQLDQNDATTIKLPGYTGGPEDAAAVESFLIGSNDGSGAVATASGSGGGFVGVTGC